ncbi:hypothetical protein ABK040_000406 [Willaertia magna]
MNKLSSEVFVDTDITEGFFFPRLTQIKTLFVINATCSILALFYTNYLTYKALPFQLIIHLTIKSILFLSLLVFYWNAHIGLMILISKIVKREFLSNSKFKKPTLILGIEIFRVVLVIVFVSLFHLVMGKNTCIYLFSLLYSFLGVLHLGTLVNNQKVPHILLFLMNFCNFLMMNYLGYEWTSSFGVLIAGIMIQILSIESLTYLKTASIQFIKRKDIQSTARAAKLYKQLYVNCPDIFLLVQFNERFNENNSGSVEEQSYRRLKDYKIMNCSQTATQMIGYSKKELLSMNLNDLIYSSSNNCFTNLEASGADCNNDCGNNQKQFDGVISLENALHNFQLGYNELNNNTQKFEQISPIYIKKKNSKEVMVCSLHVNMIKIPLSNNSSNNNNSIINEEEGEITNAKVTTCFNVIIHDLTEKFKLMDQLVIEKEKAIAANKSKSTFLAQMSHELRTPLHGIIASADLLDLDITTLSNKQRDYIASIKYSGNILLTLINDILDFCKIEVSKIKLEFKEFNLHQSLHQISDMFESRAKVKGLYFKMKMQSNIPKFIKGDEYRLVQIIINLVNNAIKFTEQGSVIFTIEKIDNDELFIKTGKLYDKDKIYLKFSIKDTGIGIAEDNFSRLFKPFSQIENYCEVDCKRNEGSGLGLYICKTLIDMMKGDVCIISKEGEGSCFSFTCPFDSIGKEEEEKEEDEQQQDLNNRRNSKIIDSFLPKQQQLLDIPTNNKHFNNDQVLDREKLKKRCKHLKVLICEDNPINQKVLKNMLTLFGIKQIDIADDGMEGMILYKKENGNYDIIFIDLFMPKLNGFGVLQEIKQLNLLRKHVLISVTANNLEETKMNCLQSGFDLFIPKPFVINQLHLSLLECLEQLGMLEVNCKNLVVL